MLAVLIFSCSLPAFEIQPNTPRNRRKKERKKKKLLKPITTTIRCSPVRSRRTRSPSTGCTAISIGRETTVNTLGGLIGIWTPDAHHILVFTNHATVAVCTVAGAGEGGDDGGKFALENDDPLLDDHVGFEVADAFDVDVEVVGFGVVVEGLV